MNTRWIAMVVLWSLFCSGSTGDDDKKRLCRNDVCIYRLARSDGTDKLMKEQLVKRGWRKEIEGDGYYDFKWGTRLRDEFTNLEPDPSVIVNHFENGSEMGLKEKMIQNFRRLPDSQWKQLVPRSYLLGGRFNDDAEFIRDFERTQYLGQHQDCDQSTMMELISNKNWTGIQSPQPSIDGHQNMWIAKPGRGTKGEGILVTNKLDKIFAEAKKSKNKAFVVQKYIENPLLIRKKKFDIRQYVLITSLDPLTIFVLEDFLMKFSSVEYETRDGDVTDQTPHLTNVAIQVNSPGFDQINMNLEPNEYLENFLRDELKQPNSYKEKVLPNIRKVVVETLKAWPKEGHRKNSFVFLGFDIMLDNELNAYLLEINVSPSVGPVPVAIAKNTKAFEGIAKIVLDNREKWEEGTSIPTEEEQQESFGSWRLAYKEGIST